MDFVKWMVKVHFLRKAKGSCINNITPEEVWIRVIEFVTVFNNFWKQKRGKEWWRIKKIDNAWRHLWETPNKTFRQFHQHFTSSLCADCLSPKITNPNSKNIKAVQNTWNKNAARNMWWNWQDIFLVFWSRFRNVRFHTQVQ